MTRLFVGNLPPKATEEQLASEFSSYGVVSAVDIKVKENANNSSSRFAFVTITIDDTMVQQCIREFKEMPFHGHYLTVSVAKESFLDKLKREREEAAKEEVEKKRPKKVETPEESEEFVVRKNAFADQMRKQDTPEDEDTFLVKKRGQGAKLVNGMLKIFGDPAFMRKEEETPAVEKDAKALQADQKRLESLERKKNAYKQQKFTIKAALANGQQQSAEKGKKIIFGDSEMRAKPVKLLDDDDDDEDVDFSIRQQFQGESGQKLLKLQSTFKGDKRFALSEDFRDDKEEETAAEMPTDEFADERKKQLEILEGVVGHPLASKPKKTFQTMLRYDPTKKDHEKYVKKDADMELEHSKKKIKQPEAPIQVSSKTFYKVNTTSIEQSLKSGSEGFSLLKMLGRDSEPVQAEQEEAYSAPSSSSKLPPGKNFKYDSSDDENGARKKKTPAKIPKDSSGSKTGGKKNKRGIFRESFFIHTQDSRLQEGADFFKSLTTPNGEFHEKRQQLRQIVSRKIKKNQLKVKSKFPRKGFNGKIKKIKK